MLLGNPAPSLLRLEADGGSLTEHRQQAKETGVQGG